MQVDETGQQHLAFGLDDLGALGAQPDAHVGDGVPVDQHVLRLAAEDFRTTDQDLAHVTYFSSIRAWLTAGSLPPRSR